jgi:hypothetical protein
MAGAAKLPLPKWKNFCPAGALDPNEIHIPGIMVQRIFKEKHLKKELNNDCETKVIQVCKNYMDFIL